MKEESMNSMLEELGQLRVLQRQVGRPRRQPADRILLAPAFDEVRTARVR
jgi:hypothetical protein